MLDGDMAGGIVTNDKVKKVFEDPSGIKMLISGEQHANPNRVFSFLAFKYYFRSVPQFLQLFNSPIDSIYMACAIIKILIHAFILYFLASIITKTKSIFKIKLVFVALLLTSLFQTYGFNNHLGIIDISISYTFFYALPIMLLLFFLYLFYFSIYLNYNNRNIISQVILFLLSIIIPFTGPIIPPTIIILSILLFLIFVFKYFKRNNKIQKKLIFLFIKPIPNIAFLYYFIISLFSLYSLYIGTFDNQFKNDLIPLTERYSRLMTGIQNTFLSPSGFTSLFQLIGFNSVVIIIFYKHVRKNILKIFIGVFICSLIYLFLLPMGGYRTYRPNIIRYDTIIPVSISLFYLCGLSTYILLELIKTKKVFLIIYLIIVGVFIYSYSKKDTHIDCDNKCEREALKFISKSNDTIVALHNDCLILSWDVITDYKDSKINGEFLKIIGVTKDVKMYYTIKSGDITKK